MTPFRCQLLLLTSAFIALTLVFAPAASAAAGINNTITIQGKLVNADGTNVTDGVKDLEFKVYNGAGSAASTLFTESWTAAALFSSTMTSAPGLDGESLVYSGNTNEASFKAGQILWNVTKKESVIIIAVNTGTNTLTISPTFQAWAISDTITNGLYVKDGIFRVALNSLNQNWGTVDFGDDALYVGIKVASDSEMKPRIRFSAVPYAMTANNSLNLGGVAATGYLRSDTSDNYTSGTLTTDSGTTLDVNGDLALADTDIALDGASTNLAATGNFSVNTNDLFITKSTGSVGVGTTAPKNAFDVSGSVAIGSLPANALPTANTLYVSGNIGIGTTNPTDTLHVVGNGLFTTGVHIGADADANLIDDASNGSGTTALYIGNQRITTEDIDTGFANPMTTAGDIIYGGASGAPTRLAGSGTNSWVLHYNTATSAPEWAADANTTYTAGNDIDFNGTQIDLEPTLDFVSTINFTGTGTLNGLDAIDATTETTLESAIDIAGDVTGTGLGSVTIAANAVQGTDISLASEARGDVMYFNGTDWVRLGAGANGSVLKFNTATTAPEWGTDTDTTYSAGNDIDFSGTRIDLEPTLDFVSTINFTGTGTINGLDAIDATTESTLESAIDIAGDVTGTGLGAVVIADNAVDGTDISLASEAIGDVMYFNGTDWVRLARSGTNGYVLKFNTATTAPEWAADAGMINPMTTKGDIIIADTAGAPIRLGGGTNGYALHYNTATSAPEWAADANTTYTAGNDIDFNGTQIDLEPTLDFVSTINLTGTGTLNGLDAIDSTTESTLESAIDIAGDVTGTGLGSVVIADNAVDGTDISLASEATGDVMYFNGTDWVRLARSGTNGYALKFNTATSAPEWAADTDTTYSAGNDIDFSGTRIDLEPTLDFVSTINFTGTGTINGLDAIDATTESTLESAIDIAGDVTGTGLGAVVIADNAVDGTDISLASEARGDVMYFNGTDWVRLGAGANGSVLKFNTATTAPEWGTDTGFANPMTTKGDIIIGGNAGAPTRLAGAGTNGYVLKYNTGTSAPEWAAETGSTYTFTNGLTLTGSDVHLGGTLEANTTVTQGNYGMTYNLNGTGDFDIQDNGTSAFFVKDDGSVGIGTTVPARRLVIAKSDSSNSDMLFQNSTTGYTSGDGLYLGIDASEEASIWNYENTALTFATNNNEVMRISTGGLVGIGTTAPGALLELAQNGSVTADTYLQKNIATWDAGNIDAVTRSLYGDYVSLTPTATLQSSVSTASNLYMYANSQALSLDNITLGASTYRPARLYAYGNDIAITGNPTINDPNGNFADYLTVIGSNIAITSSPTIAIDAGPTPMYYKGINIANTIDGGGSTNAMYNFGLDVSAVSNGATDNALGGRFSASGTHAFGISRGIQILTVSGGATNYGLEIQNPSTGANNYAIYSSATAQSYFAGNVGIGTTNPTQQLELTGDLKIGGDDLFMTTNTSGMLLIADGTNFNPTAMSGDVTITNTGATTIAANAVQGTDISLASEARGDVMYFNGTDWVRLARSASNGYVLKFNTGTTAPEWAADAGMANPMTTKGDLIIGDTAGAPIRLGGGTNGYALKYNTATSAPEWAADTDTTYSAGNDIDFSGTRIDLEPTLDFVSTINFTGTGTINGLDAIDATTESTLESAIDIAGDVTGTGLGSVTIAANAVQGTDISLASEARGDVMYFNGTDWVRLGAGANGSVLKFNTATTAPEWGTDIGTAYTFTNGLTLTGSDVHLGGTLEANTTITQGNYSTIFNLSGTGDFDIQDNGKSAFFVKDDASIGVGTTNPLAIVDIVADMSNTQYPMLRLSDPLTGQGNGTSLAFNGNDDDYLFELDNTSSLFTLGYGTRGSSTPLMAFNQYGRVGIGTTGNNSYTLEVNGSTAIDGNLTIGDAGTDTVFVSSSSWTFGYDTNFVLNGGVNGLSFDTSTLSIDAMNNRVGIGTTNPNALLHLSAASARALIESTTNGNNAGLEFISPGSSGTKQYAGLYFLGSETSSNSILSLAADNNNYQLNVTASGNVGIGTTAPTAQLEVVNTAAFDAAGDVEIGYNLNFSNDTASYIRSLSPLNIEAGDPNSAEDLVLRSAGSGDVVIGNANPSIFKADGSVTIPGNSLSVAGDLHLEGSNSSIHAFGRTTTTMYYFLEPDNGYAGWVNSGVIDTVSGWTRGLTIDAGPIALQARSSGKVGIGTTNPYTYLEINDETPGIDTGLMIRDQSATDFISMGILKADLGYISVADSGAYRNLSLLPNGGYVGIGTTNPTVKLEVRPGAANGIFADTSKTSDSNAYAIKGINTGTSTGNGVIGESSSSGSSVGVWGVYTGSNTTGGFGVVAQNNQSGSFALYCNSGNVNGCGGNRAWNNASDIRLKKDIVTIDNALNKVLALRGVNFNWKDNNQPDIGFIAQEVMTVAPELVSYDANSGYFGLRMANVTGLLVEAIKTQQSQIASVSAQLNMTDSGDLIGYTLAPNEDSYSVTHPNGNLVTRLGSFAEAVIAKLRVGSLTATEAHMDSLTVNDKSIDQMVADEVNKQLATLATPIPTVAPTPFASPEPLAQAGTPTPAPIYPEFAEIQQTTISTLSARINYLENRVTEQTASVAGIMDDLYVTPASPSVALGEGWVETRLSTLETLVASISAALDPNLEPRTSNLELPANASAAALLSSLFDIHTATDSAAVASLTTDIPLSVGMFDAESVFISDFLSVMGDTVTTNLTVTNTLNTSALSSPTGHLDLLAGLMTIDSTGGVTVTGNLTVTGLAKLNQAEVNQLTFMAAASESAVASPAASLAVEGQYLKVNLASDSAFKIADSATITASGSATFADLAADSLHVSADNATPSATEYGATITTAATAGTTHIPAGYTQVVILNPKVTQKSLVYVTPVSSTGNKTLFVKYQIDGQVIIGIDSPVTQPLSFNWWLIEPTTQARSN